MPWRCYGELDAYGFHTLEALRWLVVVLSKLLDRAEVNASGNRGQIPTLEFLQHRFS
jgi:hypothetical protein